jgi:hypothetical protein
MVVAQIAGCNPVRAGCKPPRNAAQPSESRNSRVENRFRDSAGCGTRTAKGRLRNSAAGGKAMDLSIWLPAMAILGLAPVGLMFLFVEACDKV